MNKDSSQGVNIYKPINVYEQNKWENLMITSIDSGMHPLIFNIISR